MVQGKRRLGTAIAAALLGIAGIVGCSGNQQQPAGSTKVTMSEYKFAPSTVNVKPGKVTLYLVNGGTMNHDLVLSDKSGSVVAKSALVSPGQTTTLTIENLATGDYQFRCDVPGHDEAGMHGHLVAAA
jgi:uncharacterized cupredoxin-like copper-binding protein